jgi:hypothetical protein
MTDFSSPNNVVVEDEKLGRFQDEDVEQTSNALQNVDEKKILRKMDIRLLPMLSILYLLCFLDRGNIGNAKIEGLPEELGLTSPQYNLCCLFILFFSRHCCEPQR